MTDNEPVGKLTTRAKRFLVPSLLLALVLWRLALLLTSSHIGHFKEERQGNFAVLLLEGKNPELEYVRTFGYQGSSVTSALLAVPFYAAFGPSGTSLKLCMLGLSVIVLASLLAIAGRGIAAWITGIMFILAPDMFVAYTFDAIGGAWWGCVLNSLLLLVALGALTGGKRHWMVTWGALAGFGLFLHPSCLVGVTYTAGLVILYRGSWFTPRLALMTLAAFAIGLSPYLVLGMGEDSAFRMANEAFVARTYGIEKLRSHGSVGMLEKSWITVTSLMPHSLAYRILPHGGYLAALVLAAGSVLAAVQGRRDLPAIAGHLRNGSADGRAIGRTTLVAGFVAWYLLLYIVSDITPPYLTTWAFYAKNYKILYNVLPFTLLMTGLACERLADGWRPGRWAAAAPLALVCAAGLVSGLAEMADGSFSLRSRYPSHNQAFMGRAYAKRDTISSGVARCRRHGPADRPDCLEGVGTRALERMSGSNPCAAFDPADRPFCYRGVGWELNWGGRVVQPRKTGELCAKLEPFAGECMRGYMEITPDAIYNMPPRWLRRLLEEGTEEDRRLLGPGFGVFLATRFHADPAFVLERCGWIEDELGLAGCTEAAARELGSIAGRTWPDGRPPGDLAPELVAAWSHGLGEMLAWRHHDDPGAAEEACEELTTGDPSACREGLATWRDLMDPASGAPLFPESVPR